MELLNVGFVMLIAKITFCVLPGVFGIYLLVISKETKRKMRNKMCMRLFGFSNAIRYLTFARILNFLGVFLILISCSLTWLFIISSYLQE